MPVVATLIEPLTPAPGGCTVISHDEVLVPENLLGSGNAGRTAVNEVLENPDCDIPECANVFSFTRACPTISHGTLVEWGLHENFNDPGPYTFQLLYSPTGLVDADDWEPVGSAAVNVYFMVDDAVRMFGKTNFAHYRICVQTPLDTYFSAPISILTGLGRQDRLLWRNSYKTHERLLRKQTGIEGYLLKQRQYGTKCTSCRDELTDTIDNPDCPLCYGTGFIAGYYAPLACYYAAVDQRAHHTKVDAQNTNTDPVRVKAEVLGIPQVFTRDVWVDKKKDLRWMFHRIQHKVEFRGVPSVLEVEFRLLPFSHPVYDIEITDQLVLPT